jgi:hypothetical protein
VGEAGGFVVCHEPLQLFEVFAPAFAGWCDDLAVGCAAMPWRSGSEAISSRVFRLTGAPKTSVIREPAPACEGKADREQGRSQPFGPPTRTGA